MANLYLTAGENISGLTFGGNVFGSTGNEVVTYNAGVSGITFDQNVEQVRFSEATSAFTYQQAGNTLLVFRGGTQVASVAIQGDANGTLISFSNGTVEAKLVAGSPPTITLGGATVPAASPNVVIPVVIDGSAPTQPQTLSLTINQDTVAGTGGVDTFVAGTAQDGNGKLIQTLQDVDSINGDAGNDTLNVTLLAAGAVTPSLTSVENVNVRFTTAAGADLSLANATGVTNVGVANSTVTGTVSSVGAAALSVSNQTKDATFTGSTASALSISAANVSNGAGGALKIVADGAGGAKATSLSLTVQDANIDLDSTNNAAYTTVNIAATGKNTVALTDVAAVATTLAVTGAGSVTITPALTALKTLTAGDGGITVDTTGGVLETATTGAGKDSLTVVGASVKSISTGAGNDTVKSVTSAVGATATVDLGAGDDTFSFDTAFGKGATLTGGDGTDTISTTAALYGTVSGYTAGELSKVTGFEVLSISDALDGQTIDVSKISGITSFRAAASVATTKAATVSGVGNNGSIELAGAVANNGKLTVTLKADTTADTVTLKLNHNYADNNDTTADVTTSKNVVSLAEVETLNVNSTATNTAPVTAPVTGYKVDTVTNTLDLTGSNLLTTVNVSGNQRLELATTAAQTKLATIDASTNTASVKIDASLTDQALTIKGTAGGDTITGGTKGDTITLGAGNDNLDYSVAAAIGSKIGTGNFDTITDFVANTFGNGAGGAAGTGAGAAASRTGDILTITGDGGVGALVDVLNSAADATTFLANNAGTAVGVVAALDKSTGNLYVDNSGDGVADYFIALTGVTTINAAAFVVI